MTKVVRSFYAFVVMLGGPRFWAAHFFLFEIPHFIQVFGMYGSGSFRVIRPYLFEIANKSGPNDESCSVFFMRSQ